MRTPFAGLEGQAKGGGGIGKGRESQDEVGYISDIDCVYVLEGMDCPEDNKANSVVFYINDLVLSRGIIKALS